MTSRTRKKPAPQLPEEWQTLADQIEKDYESGKEQIHAD